MIHAPALVEELRCIEEARWGAMLCELANSDVLQNTRVAIGRDIESDASFAFASTYKGTSSTSPTATTYTTDGNNIPTNTVVGYYIVTTTRIGIIQSNTSAANSVPTVDRWYDPAS